MIRAFVEGIVIRAHNPGNYYALDAVRRNLEEQTNKETDKIRRRIGDDYEESKFIVYGLKQAPGTDAYRIARARLDDLLKEHNITEEEILQKPYLRGNS